MFGYFIIFYFAVYDSAPARNVTQQRQVKHTGQGVNFGGTTIMGEQHHHEPRVLVVKPATENINQSKFTQPARTMLQPKVNLVEDPHAPGSRFDSHAPANYQTKVTDPTGAGN